MGSVKVVTGFIPLKDHPRPEGEYHALALPLVDALASDGSLGYVGWGTASDTGLREFVDALTKPKVADNPAKNTVDYHCVQHQKFIWLYEAYRATDTHPDTYVWIDYGILHVPGVTVGVIKNYLSRVEDNPPGAISIPGCWTPEEGLAILNAEYPVWRFCGGLMAVPASLVPKFAVSAMTVATYQMKSTRRAEWEVNTLARLEDLNIVPIKWYKADHNETMFTNGP